MDAFVAVDVAVRFGEDDGVGEGCVVPEYVVVGGEEGGVGGEGTVGEEGGCGGLGWWGCWVFGGSDETFCVRWVLDWLVGWRGGFLWMRWMHWRGFCTRLEVRWYGDDGGGETVCRSERMDVLT